MEHTRAICCWWPVKLSRLWAPSSQALYAHSCAADWVAPGGRSQINAFIFRCARMDAAGATRVSRAVSYAYHDITDANVCRCGFAAMTSCLATCLRHIDLSRNVYGPSGGSSRRISWEFYPQPTRQYFPMRSPKSIGDMQDLHDVCMYRSGYLQ
jgi:hypothetical protein